MSKKDFIVGSVLGIVIGILFSFFLFLNGYSFLFQNYYFIASFAVAILFLHISCIATKYRKLNVYQFAKFGEVGAVNTLIDFTILISLSKHFGIYLGGYLAVLNVFAFTTATIFSYFLNKFWTFEQKKDSVFFSQFFKFFIVSVIGLIINTSFVYAITTFFNPLFGMSALNLEILAKIFASIGSLSWNFIGYKLLVFKL